MPMSASRSARRAAAVTLVASSLLFAAACGGSDSKSDKAADKDTAKSSAPSASAPGAAGGTVSEAQLKAALLTTKDVPAGWKVDPEGGSTMGKADKAECQKFLDIVQSEPAPLGAAARQTVNFEDGGQQVFGFDGDKAAGYLKGFDASLAQCASFGVEVDGQKYPATLKPLTLDKAGDEAHGYQLVLDLTQVKMAFDNYVVRKGAALSTFSTKSKTPGGAAGAEFKTITATVAKKLDQAVKG
ncbi:hypothetical protein N4G70_02615 [Streptomyces sp. ASQP_92]|uniref:hypothetical protein n=1 Tax=Streptomyces sp. ASQP_92 TaxID=2979116 RepID=UPI0021BF6CC3|nr:hypothetical protein [Streptomyces sp. ASQP_92]MCT9087752.1 hypothetical protein [Streptomyces sp. ASQP_92]